MGKPTGDFARTAKSRDKCCGCGCSFGPKVLPVNVETEDGKDEETWCPRCFVYVRAPKEPGRFYGARAIHCLGCAHELVTRSSGKVCVQCSSQHTVLLPPVTAVS